MSGLAVSTALSSEMGVEEAYGPVSADCALERSIASFRPFSSSRNG